MAQQLRDSAVSTSGQKVGNYLQLLAALGKVRRNMAAYCLEQLGYGDLLSVKMSDLLAQQMHTLKTVISLSSGHELIILDDPFLGMDRE